MNYNINEILRGDGQKIPHNRGVSVQFWAAGYSPGKSSRRLLFCRFCVSFTSLRQADVSLADQADAVQKRM